MAAASLGSTLRNPVPTPLPPPSPQPADGPPQLLAYLSSIPDPRRAQGKRHPLPSILLLVLAATLAGRTNRREIFEWGRKAEAELCRRMGFTHGTPAESTLFEVFRALDWEQLAAALRVWGLALLEYLDPQGEAAVSCDGKVVRGSRRAGSDMSLLLSLFTSDLGVTLDLEQVQRTEGEIDVAPGLLARVPLAGRTVVMDAAYTEESLARAVVTAGADYVLPVKGNQPNLRADLEVLFGKEIPKGWLREDVETLDRGHGRDEYRRLVLIQPPPEEVMPWGASLQFFMIERRRRQRSARRTTEYTRTLTYGVTSLGREQAGAAAILKLVRGHWGIENRSHWIRDVVLGEDGSRLATATCVGAAAALRCTALSLLHWYRREKGERSVASALRTLSQCPGAALDVMGVPA